MQRRKILRRYLLSVSVLLCIFAFFAGIVTVRERTRYNMDLTPYSKIVYSENADGAEILIGKSRFFVDKSLIEKMGKSAFYGMMGDVFVNIGEFFEKMQIKN